MKQTFFAQHPGPYVIFGDSLYPAATGDGESYIARRTPSGRESRLRLLAPIPLADLEGNDVFSKHGEVSDFLSSAQLSEKAGFKDPQQFNDRLDTLAFVVGEVFPLLEKEYKSPEDAISEITKDKNVRTFQEFSQPDIKVPEIKPYDIPSPDEQLLKKMFPAGLTAASLLSKALNHNPVYVDDNWAHRLITRQRDGDRVHIDGLDLFWIRRYRLGWIEEAYLPMVRQKILERAQERSDRFHEIEKTASRGKEIFLPLIPLERFSYSSLTVRWAGSKCYITQKQMPFARQDIEEATLWHRRESFELGIACYFSDGRLHFGETPVVVADYKDIAFYQNPLGIFRTMCNQDKGEWGSFPPTADGAVRYIHAALKVFHHGFSPELIRDHIWRFGDCRDFRELFPKDQALSAKTLDEVKQAGYLPANVYLPLP